MTSNDEYVLQLLTERGYLSAEQVEAAAASMKAANETTLDVLVSGGAVDEDTVLGTIGDSVRHSEEIRRGAGCRR